MTKKDAVVADEPLVVWVDGHSASSSEGKGLEPDIRGGLPLKMFSTSLDFDQAQFDAAREKMKACPAMESSRLDFKGAAGTASSPSL
ncbi:unnamed protein product [Laminaria digitata]